MLSSFTSSNSASTTSFLSSGLASAFEAPAVSCWALYIAQQDTAGAEKKDAKSDDKKDVVDAEFEEVKDDNKKNG